MGSCHPQHLLGPRTRYLHYAFAGWAVASAAAVVGPVLAQGSTNSSRTSIAGSSTSADVLFSCTACLDCSNINFFHLVRGLKSVLDAEKNSSALSRIKEVLVVNEVRPPGSSLQSWARRLAKLLPTVRFIQKDGKTQQGQAHSLNMILQVLAQRRARYWLHWEESWRADRPFLSRAVSAMEASGALQVELGPTESWERFASAASLPGDGRLIEAPTTMRECNWTRLWDGSDGFDRAYWPLFTLHPSLMKVDSVLAADKFSESPDQWPVFFEFFWACSLLRSGSLKAVLEPPAVSRQANHKSSYQRLSNLRQLGICPVFDPECSAS